MGNDKKASDALNIIDEQRKELNKLVEQTSMSRNHQAGSERIKRWKERTVNLLAENVHPREASKLRKKSMGSYFMGDPMRNLAHEARMYDSFLIALAEEISQHPEDIFYVPVAAPSEVAKARIPEPTTSNAVFVIHGHDELNLYRLNELLRERWDLEPVIMAKEPGKGRTLIEKFEEEAQRAVFALAIMTPDDIVKIEDDTYAQSRPNVIFELGWFHGRLGREKVCILFKYGTQIHSDLDGISRIEFQDSILEKVTELENELAAANVIS